MRRTITAVRHRSALLPVLLIADRPTGDELVTWLIDGITDYVLRDDLARLPLAVQRAIERGSMLQTIERLGADGATERNNPLLVAAPRSLGDEFYQMLIANSSEGIWCFEFAFPMAISARAEVQIEHIYQYAFLVECNDTMAQMYGYERAGELIGKRLDQLLDPKDPRNEAYLRAFIAAGYRLADARSYERDRNGKRRIFLNSLIGTVIGEQLFRAWGTQRDITEHVRDELEQELRAATGTLLAEALDYNTTLTNVSRLLVPNFVDYCQIHTLNSDGELDQRIAVHRDQELQPLLIRFGSIYRPSAARPSSLVGHVVRSGKALLSHFSMELAQSLHDDEELLEIYRRLEPGSFIVVPLRARGIIQGTVSLVRATDREPFDQRDLVLAEELATRCAVALDNAALYRAAQDALQARDELLAIASHELRTPLTAIQGFATVLQRRNETHGMLNERDARVLQAIVEQGARLERLITLVLDEVRISAGELMLEQTRVNLAALIQAIVAQIEPGLERHRVQFVGEPPPLFVVGDELRLEQLFQHLLLNAVKYSPGGGVVEVNIHQAAEALKVMIRDEGIGVPSDQLPLIGQRFFRARNVNPRQISGTGIGLFVVRAIVAAHQGTIEIASVEGRGTTVTVSLPLAPAE